MVDNGQPDDREDAVELIELGEQAEPPAAGAARADEPAGSERWYASSGRPPAADWLAGAFPTNFAAGASGMMRTDVRVRLTAVASAGRGAPAAQIEEPTCSYALSASAEPGPGEAAVVAIVEFSAGIAAAMVECLLGGTPTATPAPHRALTPAERRALRRLADLAAASLSASRKPADLTGLRARIDMTPMAGPGDDGPLVAAVYELALAGRVGTMKLWGGEDVLGSAPVGRKRSRPVRLALTVALEGVVVDADDLAALAEGDIVATEVPVDGEVIVRIGGIPKFAARLGTSGQRKTLTITRRLGDRPAR
jgi:flagellar motor switch protein FliM